MTTNFLNYGSCALEVGNIGGTPILKTTDGTSAKDLTKYYTYTSTQLPFEPGKTISTLKPRSRVAIECLATIVLSAIGAFALYLSTGSIVWCWPAVALGATYLAWTAYSQLMRKDPLVEAFYKIVGGKKEFDKLPEFKLPSGKIDSLAAQINWDKLSHPIYRAKTWDGRKIMIVKGLSLHKEENSGKSAYPKAVFVFVEKMSYGTRGFGMNLNDQSITKPSTLSQISTDLANEFAIQWKNRFIQNFDSAPGWQTIHPGLNLEGVCKNNACKAFNDSIIVSKGFGVFNICREVARFACPECKHELSEQTPNCVFFNCYYSVEGLQKAPNGDKIPFHHSRIEASDNRSQIFDLSKFNWFYLDITTEQN